jgi:hypothetical protein
MTPEEIRAKVEEYGRPDIVREENLPIWGEQFFRKISAEARFGLIAIAETNGGKGLPSAVAIAATWCTSDGTLIYKDLAEGLKAINAMRPEQHDPLAAPALRASGLAAKSLEDAEGKS